jgi:hypothetical protein
MGTGTELEWTVVDDEEDWPEPTGPPSRTEQPRRHNLLFAALALFTLIIGTTLFLRFRIAQNQRQLRADLQALVDLEARAVARSDRELFLSLKSPDDLAWFQEQQGAFDYVAAHPGDWPRLEVTSVELVDDYAWVQTTGIWEGRDERFQEIRFYRWLDNTWRQVAPDLRYWGPLQERTIGPLNFVYRQRDEPYVEPLAAGLTRFHTHLCQDLGCSTSLSLTVQLTLPHLYEYPALAPPHLIVLSSPTIWPQPVDGPPQLPAIGFQSEDLAHFYAFEAAGGEERWERNTHGAFLVQAAANWTHQRFVQGIEGSSWRFNTGQGQELLRVVVRNGRIPSLDELWRAHDFKSFSYPAMTQTAARYVNLQSARARAVIDYVAETYGQSAVPVLLQAIGRHDTLDATLQEALDVDLGAFEPAWLTWMGIHYGFGKGWRLAQAAAYWEETQGSSFLSSFRDSVGTRQYRELMRTAVQGERVLSLDSLWDGDYWQTSPNIGPVTSISAAWPGSSAEMPSALDVFQVQASDELFTADPAGQVIGQPSSWRNAHALAVIRYVAQIYGRQAVYDLLSAIVRNETFDDALRDALGVSLTDFETAWLSWLKAHYGNG